MAGLRRQLRTGLCRLRQGGGLQNAYCRGL
nr:MAG TPA: hypothetical protein [Caudoviricetes sp.]